LEVKILISGGTGFLGRNLTHSFIEDGHEVYILTRGDHVPAGAQAVQWDAKTITGWGHLVNEIDVVIHLAGKSLSSWPWTGPMKQSFLDSRLSPGLALVEAIRKAARRPRIFIQQSGINHYGLRGPLADESTPPADDFLAQLTVKWENATQSLEELGLQRIVIRSAVVLGRGEGLMPLMALPVQLFLGGSTGSGQQAMPWIHIKDWVRAVRHLIENKNARGAYNLITPTPTSNAEFNQTLANVLHRPCWLHVPAFLMRNLLGEMNVLIVEGRPAQPKRLIESGYQFQFSAAREAFLDLYRK
jgi:uncharacterized protein (TIGR01777 family)